MKKYLKLIGLNLVPEFLKKAILHQNKLKEPWSKFLNSSFSQEGEDLLLKRYLHKIRDGFYVDIGAHHPFRFSNTFLFYKIGWNGINIDAMPGSMQLFKEFRARDINLEIAIAADNVALDYYIFKEKAFNTLDKMEAEKKINAGISEVESIEKLQTKTLAETLEKYLPKNKKIDFMSVDVEGLDLQILKSNNWEKYRPTFILVEDLQGSIAEVYNREIFHFLNDNKYELKSRTYNSLLFADTLK